MDTIAQALTTIKNSVMAKREVIEIPYSNIVYEIGKILKTNQYLEDILVKVDKETKNKFIIVKPRYVDGNPVLNNVKRISKLSRRIYSKASDLHNIRKGYGILIVSTPKGVMTGADARIKKVGGEVLAEIW